MVDKDLTPVPATDSQERWEVVRLGRAAVRHFRWGVRLLVAGVAVLLAAQLASVYRLFHDLHPWAGVAAAVAFGGLLAWLIVWPLMRLLRVPRAVDPPRMPPEGEREARHREAQIRYLGRYLGGLSRNPLLADSRAEIAAVSDRLESLAEECRRHPDDAERRIVEFEEEWVLPLLAPLDRQADAMIRREALAVGSLTALSRMGTVDAFLVLWRDVNLVASVSRIYFGRPGLRGTWHIVRDVASAILLSSVLEQLSHLGTGVVRKMGEGGRHLPLVGAVVGPLLDGTINALMTMKIGYLAKERCRSFQAWDPETTRGVVRRTFKRVGDSAAGLVAELQDLVGHTLGRVRAGADLGKDVLVQLLEPDRGDPAGAAPGSGAGRGFRLKSGPGAADPRVMTLLAASDLDLAPALDPEALEGLWELVEDDDTSFLEDLFSTFLASIPGVVASVRAALDGGDLDTVRREAHGLKGASGNVTALVLAERCQELENAARDGDPEAVRAHLDAVEAEARRVRLAVANSLPSLSLA